MLSICTNIINIWESNVTMKSSTQVSHGVSEGTKGTEPSCLNYYPKIREGMKWILG